MRFTDYVGAAVTLWKSFGDRMQRRLRITTWCNEFGATHSFIGQFRAGQCHDAGTMLHEPWCSVDMRNIRRNVTVVRR
jgi:hypothetical protein